MLFVFVVIKFFGVFGEGNVKIVIFCLLYIKEVGFLFVSMYFKWVFVINFFLVIFVIYYLWRFSYVNENVFYKSK